MANLKVAFLGVLPAPYQQDIFTVFTRQQGIDLHVYYLEPSTADSPWPEKALAPYEELLPGFAFSLGKTRFHFNWPLLDLRKADVVIVNLTLTSFAAQWLMRRGLHGKPWIFWGERLRDRGGASRTLHDWLTAPLQRATAIVGVGTRATEDYRRRFFGPLHFSVPYHCDLKPFLERSPGQHPGDEFVFLCCGQMIARKGIDLLLHAFARLVPENPHVRLILVGREAELPRMLAPLSAQARAAIRFEGFQPVENLPDFFSRADAFVLPSRYDGWGVVVNQALGAGLAVICSDAVGAGHDLVEEGVNGAKFTSENANELFEKMKQSAADPARTLLWGNASRKKAAEISPETGVAKWLAILESVTGKK